MNFDKKKCLSIPSKGGLSAAEVKALASSLGIVSNGTKAVLCDLIEGAMVKPTSLKVANAVTKEIPAIIPTIIPQANVRKVKPLPPLPITKPALIAAAAAARPVSPIAKSALITAAARPVSTIAKPVAAKPVAANPELSKMESLYAELDDLIATNSEKYECCLGQYKAEISAIEKKRFFTNSQAKKVKTVLDSIKKGILDGFYKKYQEFYQEYFYLLAVSNRDKAVESLKRWIPELNDTYIRLTYSTLSKADKEDLHYLFPPNYIQFDHYEEDTNRICASLMNRPKDKKQDISTLLCFRTYIMQFMTRLELLFKEIDQKLGNGNESELSRVLKNENLRLSELQKYLDGLFLCRKDHCDEKNCTKKSRVLRSTTCEPIYKPTFK